MSQGEDNGMCLDPLRENGRRKEDRSLLARLANVGIKYHWLFTLLFLFFLALGFDFKTPAKLFAEIRGEIKVNKEVTDAAIKRLEDTDNDSDRESKYVRDLLELSVIAQCKSMPKSATQYLPCRRLYNERGIE